MSRGKKMIITIISLVLLYVALWTAFTLTEEKETWVKMLVAAVICGIYGVGQNYIRNRYK